MSETEVMDKADIQIIDIPREPCYECGDETDGPFATKIIMIDFRLAGTVIQFGNFNYCDACALEQANRLREGLPEEPKD